MKEIIGWYFRIGDFIVYWGMIGLFFWNIITVIHGRIIGWSPRKARIRFRF